MIAIPSIELRAADGPALADAAWRARELFELGFDRLQLIDVDAALGRRTNHELIEEILEATGAAVQVGGGVRTEIGIHELISQGAARVVVGTRAVREPFWIADQAEQRPGVLVVAADLRDGQLVVDGQSTAVDRTLFMLVDQLNDLPLAALLVTTVDPDEERRRQSLEILDRLCAQSVHPVIAAGGIDTLDDLRAVSATGVAEAVFSTALDGRDVLRWG